MKTPFTPSRALRRGFTLIELLTVIAIIGILAAILIPTVSRVREQAKRAKCMSNVRQITVALVNYAGSSKGQAFPTNSGAQWPWDLSVSLANTLSGNASREMFYCPSSNMLTYYTIDQLFPYGGQNSSYAVTGYVLLLDGTPKVEDFWRNARIKPEYEVQIGSLRAVQPASRRALVVDAVISNGDDFANVPGGLTNNVSNHMEGSKPLGGHTGYVDGSVKWRRFVNGSKPLDPTTYTKKCTSNPIFWF